MTWSAVSLLLVVTVVATIVVAFALLRLKSRASVADWPVHAKRLLSEREQVIYHRLRRAYPNNPVLAQVAFSQLIGMQRGKHSVALFNRYGCLVADFLVCTPDFMPLAVIELDGHSHDSPRRARADATKAAVLEAAGVALVRLNSRAANDEADLHAVFPPPGLHVAADPASAGRRRA